MNIRPADDYDKDRWNEFVLKFSDSPYHLYQWKEIFERVYRYECKYLIAEEDERKIVAVFPVVMIKSKLFGTRISSLPLSDYGGPIFAPDQTNSLLVDSFLEYLSPLVSKADYLEVRSPIQPEVATFLDKRLEPGNVKYVTFVIDLSKSFDEIWRLVFDKYLRNAIRKAVKNKIMVVEGNFEEHFDDFYRIYALSMKRLGSPPHDVNFFTSCHQLLGENHVKLFLATLSNEVIGGVLTFLGRHTIYPVYEGIDQKCRHLNPASLIFCRIIEWGCEKYRYFNFGRTLHGSGVYNFKKQWGGEEVVMPYYYLGRKIPRQDPRQKYSFLSKLWSRIIPFSITKRIGPHLKGSIGY